MKTSKKYIIAIDLGGTKLLVGLLDQKNKIVQTKKVKVQTHISKNEFFVSLTETIENVIEKSGISLDQVLGIGMGCPGIIDPEKGIIRVSPNISYLKNFPMKENLEKHFNIPVAIENDVNAGLLGEQQFGSAKGVENVVGIFMGTGVGGALILNGQIYRGSTGAAGEIGHTFLNLPSFSDSVREGQTVESLTGRLAIASEASYLMSLQKAPHLYGEVGEKMSKIKSKSLLRSIQSGDKAIHELIMSKARMIGMSMANCVNLLNPEKFVLGGGLVEAMGEIIIPEAQKTMKKYALNPLADHVEVVEASLGDYSVLMGASQSINLILDQEISS